MRVEYLTSLLQAALSTLRRPLCTRHVPWCLRISHQVPFPSFPRTCITDFMSQGSSHTPPMNGFVDPTTETPLFSLPRQTRISIRAPADESDGKGSRKGQLRQSGVATRTPTVSSPLQGLDSSSQNYFPLTRVTRPSSTDLLFSSGGKQEGGANKSAPIDIPQKRTTFFEDHDEYGKYGAIDFDSDTE
jgi:hypothetical protein